MISRLAASLLIVVAASCGSSEDAATGVTSAGSVAAGPSTSVDPPAASRPPGEPPTSTPASKSTPETLEEATTSPPSCGTTGQTGSQASGDPMKLSWLVGKDIRTGAHECFERTVIELQGSGEFPGWTVEYQPDPIVLGESNETAAIKGDATLVVRLGSWMQSMDNEGYDGPSDIFPTNVAHILELRLVENFEGVTRWAIGVDRERPFVVTQLTDPPRLVIDVDTST